LPATTGKPGEPYEDLAELYGRMLGQWTLEMNHVAAIVGGFETQEKYIGQEGVIFTPVSRDRQKRAVTFLNENAFVTPAWAIDPEILRRIQAVGVLASIRNAQSSVLSNLLSSPRFNRLVEQEALDGTPGYSPAEFLADIRAGVWKELADPRVRVGPYRRNVQRAYLDLVNTKLNGSTPNLPAGLPPELVLQLAGGNGDEKPLYRAELRSLSDSITSAIGKAADRETKAHLEGARDQIARILDPRFAPPSGNSGGAAIRIGFDPLWGMPGPSDLCWPDYVVRPE
jgi:hypothetical protein